MFCGLWASKGFDNCRGLESIQMGTKEQLFITVNSI